MPEGPGRGGAAPAGDGVRGDLTFGTIPALVGLAAGRYGEREALVDGPTRLSYTALANAVIHGARAFMRGGLEPGDRVAIWAPNTAAWVVAALSAVSAGGILVPLNTRLRGREASDILERSGARLLVTVTDFLGTDHVSLLGGDALAALRGVVTLEGPARDGVTTWESFLAAGDAVPYGLAEARVAAVRPDDISDVIFTSGTTGRPKGVMVTHAQSLRVFADWAAIVGLREGDRYLVVNPFFHTFGYKAGLLASLMVGATVVPHAVFDVDAVLAAVEAEAISVLPGPPTLYQSILDHRRGAGRDLAALRLAVTGAAAVPVELVRRMSDELGLSTVITGYGLTECTGAATMCRHDDDAATVATTSGRAMPATEVRVVGEDGSGAEPGAAGEILVRGYHVMTGYLDDPEATAAAVDPEGWLRTGDIGVMDERGYLSITDRKKDMFIVGGFNAYPAEIEGALLEHPGVAGAAVVGVADERLGEVGMAFVVASADGALDSSELVSWARGRLANFKVPRHVRVVGGLPLNASGKVDKQELRAQAERSLAPAGRR